MVPGKHGSERRAHRRLKVKDCRIALAPCKFLSFSPSKPGKPQIMLDVSHGGVGVASAEYIEPGKKFDLTLTFTEDSNIYKARGVVVYCKKMEQGGLYRVGMKFSKKDKELDRTIRYLVEKFV